MDALLGTKIEMSQTFDDKGNFVPVTLVLAGPCFVLDKKNISKEKKILKLGFEKQEKANLSKRGQFKKIGLFHFIKEFKASSDKDYKIGDKISSDLFAPGDKINIKGVSKGKGFQGVVKRYNFKGDLATHGRKHSLRKGGSIACRRLSKVAKGQKMPGRMGGSKTTIFNLKVAAVDKENNILAIKGGLPGKRGDLLEIRKAY